MLCACVHVAFSNKLAGKIGSLSGGSIKQVLSCSPVWFLPVFLGVFIYLEVTETWWKKRESEIH